MADRQKGLAWVDGALLALVLLGVFDLVTQGFPRGPFIATAVVVVTSAISVLLVCNVKDVYRWVFRYFTAFLLSMIFGIISFGPKFLDFPLWMELPLLLLVASLPVIMSFIRSDRESAHRWLAFALFLGLMVAMFSGSAGAGGEMIAWLQDKFDLTFEQAKLSNFVFRKSVHVTFYALMFFSMARAAWQAREKLSLSLLAGFVWATGHAAFDETVQSFFDDRSGSIKDYLTDASGMAVALVLCLLLWGRRKS